MTTLEIIRSELRRQADESKSQGLGWFDDSDPAAATVDGKVNLVELAAAIDRAKPPVSG